MSFQLKPRDKCPYCNRSASDEVFKQYVPLGIKFKGKTPEEFNEQDKKEFVEWTKGAVEDFIRRMCIVSS